MKYWLAITHRILVFHGNGVQLERVTFSYFLSFLQWLKVLILWMQKCLHLFTCLSFQGNSWSSWNTWPQRTACNNKILFISTMAYSCYDKIYISSRGGNSCSYVCVCIWKSRMIINSWHKCDPFDNVYCMSFQNNKNSHQEPQELYLGDLCALCIFYDPCWAAGRCCFDWRKSVM